MKKTRAKEKKKRGPKKGHPGTGRALIPESEVSEIVPCYPPEVCSCGAAIETNTGTVIQRTQTIEIPEIKPVVTEYQTYQGVCKGCGKVHTGTPPETLPPGMLGIRLMAMMALFSGTYHLSKRKIQSILKDIFNVALCLGTIANNENRVSEAIEPAYTEAHEFVKSQPVVHADETSHQQAGHRGWLWLVATATVAIFMIRCSRSTKVAKELLGEAFSGILTSDRYAAYNWILPKYRKDLGRPVSLEITSFGMCSKCFIFGISTKLDLFHATFLGASWCLSLAKLYVGWNEGKRVAAPKHKILAKIYSS